MRRVQVMAAVGRAPVLRAALGRVPLHRAPDAALQPGAMRDFDLPCGAASSWLALCIAYLPVYRLSHETVVRTPSYVASFVLVGSIMSRCSGRATQRLGRLALVVHGGAYDGVSYLQSPRAVDGGLLKCFVTRERLRMGSVRFCMYLGAQSDSPATGKFLLAALQTSR